MVDLADELLKSGLHVLVVLLKRDVDLLEQHRQDVKRLRVPMQVFHKFNYKISAFEFLIPIFPSQLLNLFISLYRHIIIIALVF
jgi:hypothetical protein